jgi:hypothetical protein
MTDPYFTAMELASVAAAGAALAAYRRDDKQTAAALLEELQAEYGHPGIFVAMLTWADAVAEAAGPAPSVGIAVFDETHGDRRTPIDEAPPWAAWSARLISARARRDHDQCHALLLTCSKDTKQFTDCFNGLLHVAAQTLNSYDAGKPRRVRIV